MATDKFENIKIVPGAIDKKYPGVDLYSWGDGTVPFPGPKVVGLYSKMWDTFKSSCRGLNLDEAKAGYKMFRKEANEFLRDWKVLDGE